MPQVSVQTGPNPSTIVQIGAVCDYISPKEVANLPEFVSVRITDTRAFVDKESGVTEIRVHLRSLDNKWKTSVSRPYKEWSGLLGVFGIRDYRQHKQLRGKSLWVTLAVNEGLVDVINVAPYQREDRHVDGQ